MFILIFPVMMIKKINKIIVHFVLKLLQKNVHDVKKFIIVLKSVKLVIIKKFTKVFVKKVINKQTKIFKKYLKKI